MKFYSLLAATALLLAGATSCRKDASINYDISTIKEVPNAKRMIQTSMFNEPYTISYNADGSIKDFSRPSGQGGTLKDEFVYNGNTITQNNYLDGVKVRDYVITMLDGRMAKYVSTAFTNGNPVYVFSVYYSYDAKGRLVLEMHNTNDRYEFDYDANDNLVERRYYDNDVYKVRSQYEYYTDKQDKWMSVHLMDALGRGALKPMLAKNLRKRIVNTNMQTQEITADQSYTYETDKDGFVVKGKVVGTNGYTQEWTNVYQ
jgi:YD repeat-containing protein